MPRATPPGLTPKQKLFADTYLVNGGNGTDAARKAGYKGSEGSLGVQAHDNLKNPNISAYIKNRAKPDEDKRAADIATVHRRLMEICAQDEDRSASVKAASVLAKILGMEAPKRLEAAITGIVTLPASARPAEYERLRGEIFGAPKGER